MATREYCRRSQRGEAPMPMSAQENSANSHIPALTRWGVSAQADLVYRMLTAFGASPETAIARALELPAKTVQTGLDELHSLGAAEPLPDPPQSNGRTWRATPVAAVVSTVRNRQALLANARHHLGRQLSALDIVDRSAAVQRAARPIYGVSAVRRRLAELVSTERREHLAMNPERAFTATSARAAIPASRAALRRGVTAWTLGVPVSGDDQSEAHTKELYGYGLQYRELPQQPIKMMIMDRATAFLPLDPSALFSRGVWEISCPAAVGQLVSFFLRHWSIAIEPSPDGWVPPTALSAREQAIVGLLAAGATDATVATELDISVRTVAYTMRELMDRHGVQTRFQLGLVLGSQSGQNTCGKTTDGEEDS
jgi:DNA-binding CsgD family transcriptional regulator